MTVLIAKGQAPRFHVVISASSQPSILSNCSIAFGSRLKVVKIPCITFGEYLIYKNKLAWSNNFSLSDLADKITEDDHIDYILNGWRFDDSFRTPEDYLRGCIEETAAFEMNKSWPGRRSKALDSKDIDNVLAVVYTILSRLHDNDGKKFLYTHASSIM